MLDDGTIDYSDYSLSELLEAREAINKDEYPINFQNLVIAIEGKDVQPDSSIKATRPEVESYRGRLGGAILCLGAIGAAAKIYLSYDEFGLVHHAVLFTLIASLLSVTAGFALIRNFMHARLIAISVLTMQIPVIAISPVVWSFNAFGGISTYFKPNIGWSWETDYQTLSIIWFATDYSGPTAVGINLFPLAMLVGLIIYAREPETSSISAKE